MENTLGQERDYMRELGVAKKNTIDYGEKTADNVRKRYMDSGGDESLSNSGRLKKAIKEELREQVDKQVMRRAERLLQKQVFNRVAKERIKKYAEKKFAELVAKKALLRGISAAFAATIIGIIVSYLLTWTQYYFGNLLHYRWMPKLNLYERLGFQMLNMLVGSILIIIAYILAVLILSLTSIPFAVEYWGGEIL